MYKVPVAVAQTEQTLVPENASVVDQDVDLGEGDSFPLKSNAQLTLPKLSRAPCTTFSPSSTEL